MTVSELRIGNWVAHDGLPFYIRDVEDLSDIERTLKHGTFTPIPLTEEWLLKFGFQLHSEYSFRNFMLPKNKFFICRWMEDKPSVGVEETGAFYWSDHLLKIEYVHQLQNLYWCLCGEELTIAEQ